MNNHLLIQRCGVISYQDALDMQIKILEETVEKKKNQIPTQHHILICEHPPVYTLGKSGKIEHLLFNQKTLKEKNIKFFHTNRGGDITFHGLGQLVAYPILDLEKIDTDISKYLRALEEVIIQLLSHYGIKGERSEKETGVWLDPSIPNKARKICAIGIKLSRWVSMHGLAFNVNTDLSYFEGIVPCGIKNKKVTSLARELQKEIDLQDEVVPLFEDLFCKQFQLVKVS